MGAQPIMLKGILNVRPSNADDFWTSLVTCKAADDVKYVASPWLEAWSTRDYYSERGRLLTLGSNYRVKAVSSGTFSQTRVSQR
ncbi:hypothetical protein RRG08_022461 [Elysia crispata]|uniref:Uncharacterized protein n=1 Tax=Elysia crispata TaxID=231223 RepID=A0AAE1D8V8_9GAST|nr:hypothetical protein RRG08_022461 [Elysia crispata]